MRPEHVAVEQRVHGPGGPAQRAVEAGEQLGRALRVGPRVVGVDHLDVGAGPQAEHHQPGRLGPRAAASRRVGFGVVATPVTSSTVAKGRLGSVPGMSIDTNPVDPGRIGIWTGFLDREPSSVATELAAEIEQLGYGALWVPEAVGREPLVSSTLLLGATRPPGAGHRHRQHLRPWRRWPPTRVWRTLTEAFPGRFLLGLGVSHQPMVEGLLGPTYEKPLSAMRTYLDAMDAALFLARPGTPRTPAAAGRPGPQDAGAWRPSAPAGPTPTSCPPSTPRWPATDLGAGRAACASSRPWCSRPIPPRPASSPARHTAIYLTLPNYTNNLRRFGFDDADFADGAATAWSTPSWPGATRTTVAGPGPGPPRRRRRPRLPPGHRAEDYAPGVEQWRRLAPAVLG